MRICYLANASSVHTDKWITFFASRKHEIHVISFENAQIEGVCLHLLKLPVLVKNATYPLKLASVCRIKALVKKIKPDILHAHFVTNYGLLGALIDFYPLITTAWGSDVLASPNDFILSRMKKYIAKFALKKADLITCDAEHMKDMIKRLEVSPEKIRLIHFGIDIKKFYPCKKSKNLKTRLGIKDSPTVISLRNLNPIYDLTSLVKSAPLVLKEIPKTKFIIAGKGSEEQKLRELTMYLGIQDSVKFIGFIQNDELPHYLNNMDVYVSTSLSDAGIAASTAEAMACGLPVIVTDVADNRKWVKDGTNGFVIERKNPKSLAEKIIYLLKNDEIRKKFGRINRKIIEERNDYYKEMRKMEEIYASIIQRRKT